LRRFEQLPLFRLPGPGKAARLRHIRIGNAIVSYELRQAAGRRLAMTIDERGLRVGAPRNASLRSIEDFILSNGDWVTKKLAEYASRHGSRRLLIRDGARIPILGEEIFVQVTAGANRAVWQEGRLVLAARPGADLDALARRALQRRALAYFGQRVAYFSHRLGRPAPAIALSSARTRWGSCSQESGVRLNWRLVHLPPEFAHYVIAHELAHLVEMNHSPRFWKVVARLFPDWQQVRSELKRRAAEIPLL
jgi:hypothetical protein